MSTEQLDRELDRAPERPRPVLDVLCACGQELDVCTGDHCPRCGAAVAH
jgi:hypothetical protein